MKITRISVQNFRAFDECFDLNLHGGKNLLLYGENGSGKSSIYLALKRFFEEQGDDILKYRNHFAPSTRVPHVHVHIKGKNTDGKDHDIEFRWDVADGHPLPVPKDPNTAPIPEEARSLLVDGARRAGFVARQRKREEIKMSNPGVSDFLPLILERDVEAMRSTVLNQLSHAGAPGLVRADVRDSLKTLEAFHKHNFPNA